jgi:hypothetical protein
MLAPYFADEPEKLACTFVLLWMYNPLKVLGRDVIGERLIATVG